MKRIFAAILAFLLLFACGCAPEEAPAATPTPPPEGLTLDDSVLTRSQDVETLLICAVSYDDDNHSTLTSLSVLARKKNGDIDLLTIPKDTRVWVEDYDKNGVYQSCSYGAISEVYYAAESAGLAEKKTVEAVSRLLGGVRIDRFATLNVVQLRDLADLTDGIYLYVEDAITEHGIVAGYQNILPYLEGYASYSYLNDIGGVDYPGTDPYKLQRHQMLIQELMQSFALELSKETDATKRQTLCEAIRNAVRTDMTNDDLMRWMGNGDLRFTDVRILSGRQDERRDEAFWIPDNAAMKAWVLERFYPEVAGESR